MTKSAIILLAVIWLLCTLYYTLGRAYEYPHTTLAMVGTWIASGLLLICIIIYINKHRGK